MDTPPPSPLEWHPAYDGQTWLLDWLEGRGPYFTETMRVPKVRVLRLDFNPQRPARTASDDVFLLTRSRAWGPAPYVGRPFIYMWNVATDQLGRGIAGESWINYVDDAPSFICPRCFWQSYHPTDVQEGYCGNCHDWTSPPAPLLP